MITAETAEKMDRLSKELASLALELMQGGAQSYGMRILMCAGSVGGVQVDMFGHPTSASECGLFDRVEK